MSSKRNPPRLTLELVNAEDRQKAMAINLQAPAPNFQVGDMVRLLRRNITTTSPRAKLDYTKLGPFHISECINPVAIVTIFLPTITSMTFFMYLSWRFTIPLYFPCGNLLDHRPSSWSLAMSMKLKKSSTPSFYVENSIKLYNLVCWKGYLIFEPIWEPHHEVVHDFHLRYPHKSRT